MKNIESWARKVDEPGTPHVIRKEVLKNDVNMFKGYRSQLEGSPNCKFGQQNHCNGS